MKLDIIDIDKFIDTNRIPRISDPVDLNSERIPTTNGLFSYELFGTPGSGTRKNQFGYIELGTKYFHPLVYITLKSLQRNLLECISGAKKFKVTSLGEVVVDENGETGIDFLYKNWSKIKFKKKIGENQSEDRLSRINFLRSLSKEEVFLTKFLVVPPFYRDMDWAQAASGVIVKDEVNNIYSRLIAMTSTRSDSEMAIVFESHELDFKIQNILVELYEWFTGLLAKKNGMIKKNLLGKTVDYSVRLVISAKKYSDSSPVDYEHVGIPIAYLAVLFYPFLIRELTVKFTELFEISRTLNVLSPTGVTETIELHDNAYLDYLPKELEKRIKLFIRDKHSRTEPIMVLSKNGKKVPIGVMEFGTFSLYKTENRAMTWLDIIFNIMNWIIKDKHVYVSRYPLDTVHNIFPSKVVALSTTETVMVVSSLGEMPFYPLISDNMVWIDTLQFSSCYLSGLNADFDGDTVSVRPLFSQEANLEAHEIMRSPKMLLNPAGGTLRTLKNEGVLGMYALTK